MHSYSTNSRERRIIPFFLAGAAIGSAFLISRLFKVYNFTPPWWLSLPVDTMALYGLFYYFFDRVMWKWKWVHLIFITKIPDLSGEWRGRASPIETPGVSAGFGIEVEITLTIRQTWTELLVVARTTQSKSYSISGSLVVSEENVLSYEYVNEPGVNAVSTMHTHRGTTRLILDGKNEVLNGEYYSGRDRQNIGVLKVTRINKNQAA